MPNLFHVMDNLASKEKMHIILIGNYLYDRQESMNRFSAMLKSGLCKAGVNCEIWHPNVFFGKLARSTNSGFGKWLGYIDKWIIFPFILRIRLRKNTLNDHTVRFHICDHSNAPYLHHLPSNKTIITCHDVLAIMGALKYEHVYCNASPLGKLLQKWILKNLASAKKIAAVSQQTLKQLHQLTSPQTDSTKEWRVIYNGFNNDFKPLKRTAVAAILETLGIKKDVSFLLHVGSDLPRKNRKMLVDMAAILGSNWNGKICYAGSTADTDLLNYAASLGLKDRILSIVKPDHESLTALYCGCDAFVFPSYSEGFGWPVIEAQSCGAPVIASNIEPIPEVSGGAALHCDVHKPREFADAYYALRNMPLRNELIQKGFENCLRFDNKQMIRSYLDLYGLHENLLPDVSKVNYRSSSMGA